MIHIHKWNKVMSENIKAISYFCGICPREVNVYIKIFECLKCGEYKVTSSPYLNEANKQLIISQYKQVLRENIHECVRINDKTILLQRNFGTHFFPNLICGDYVFVKFGTMKKMIKVQIIDCGKNGDLENCLFFKYKNTKYYLSQSNFVRFAHR